MIGFTIIGWIGPILLCALCWGLFRKAGFCGGILAVAFLPLVGVVLASAFNVFAALGYIDGAVGYYLVSSLIGMAFYCVPLAVLLFKVWPTKSDEDVFK